MFGKVNLTLCLLTNQLQANSKTDGFLMKYKNLKNKSLMLNMLKICK
jgi:hypothetical protein